MLKQKETRAQKNEEINEFLERSEARLYKMAWQLVPRDNFPTDDLDLVVNDIVQNTEIKYWLAASQWEIAHPQSYIQTILRHEVVNLVRKRRILSFPLYTNNELLMDEEGELYQGAALLVTASEGTEDPAQTMEQEETKREYAMTVVDLTMKLPPIQKRAMLASLGEHVADFHYLTEAFMKNNISLESLGQPIEKSEEQDYIPSYRSSLSIARKKLRTSFKKAEIAIRLV